MLDINSIFYYFIGLDHQNERGRKDKHGREKKEIPLRKWFIDYQEYIRELKCFKVLSLESRAIRKMAEEI